ncbi:hypothetical protein [Leifsonia sp. 2MCAF36]|uniref:hypothetical protein n=1 Tax=Leifsonia sp. 2MCAF36 TaxID=3232988 RepID=UPI003F9BDD63
MTETTRTTRITPAEIYERLREVIADGYAPKLPLSLSVEDFARLTQRSAAQIRRAISRGEVVVSISGGRRRIVPADNLEYLRRQRLLRASARPGIVSLDVPTRTHEQLQRLSRATKTSVEELLAQLVGSALQSRSAASEGEEESIF